MIGDKKMEYWDIDENPTGTTYQQLIKVLCDYSDKFYFVTRKELDYDEATIKMFEPYVLKTYKTREWDATKTSGPKATVYEITINGETCQLLQTLANSLYDWVSPDLPEDLTFIKNNFVWFYSCTHEDYATFTFRSAYYKQLVMEIKSLKLVKV